MKKRILVVDDNEAIHESFTKIFSNKDDNKELNEIGELLFDNVKTIETEDLAADIVLDSAYQGQDALELVKQSVKENYRYSLAFMDIRMPPGWDGIETISKIWEIDPNIKMIICTAHSDYSLEEITQKLNKSRNFLILKKPFEVIEIRQIVYSLTNKNTEKSS